jgi:hypothetical protein
VPLLLGESEVGDPQNILAGIDSHIVPGTLAVYSAYFGNDVKSLYAAAIAADKQ